MSNLMIALGSLGGVVLAGIVAHGAWSARRAGPKRAERVSAEPGSGMAEPREPVMDGASLPFSADEAGATEPTGFDTAASESGDLRRPRRRLVLRVDPLIDAVATLRLEAPILGMTVLPHLPASRRAGGKPFMIEGLNTATAEWELPTSAGSYSEFQAGLQLANRTGALNEIEYSEFVQKVQAFAEAVGAMADFPDMLEAVAGARELDRFASDHDAQLAVHLQARRTPWSVAYIQQQASRHGFVSGVVPGRLVMPATEEGAPPVLTLTFDPKAALADDPDQVAVRDLTLAFDVPQTDPGAAPFAAWQTSAQALANDLEALIVDDAGRPLAPEGFAGIDTQLGQVYAQLAAREIAAGSSTARRLFS